MLAKDGRAGGVRCFGTAFSHVKRAKVAVVSVVDEARTRLQFFNSLRTSSLLLRTVVPNFWEEQGVSFSFFMLFLLSIGLNFIQSLWTIWRGLVERLSCGGLDLMCNSWN